MKIYKSLLSISFIIAFLIINNSVAWAADYFEDREVFQGTAVEVKVPKFDHDDVDVWVDGKELKVFDYRAAPNFDEPISRGEFLRLMFENVEFGEVDTSGVDDFPDVAADHPYYDYVKAAAALDIVHGYEDGLFRPNATITRGQISKVLARAFNPELVLSVSPRFSDVPENHVFYIYINQMVKAEIFQGYPDGLMRPDREINVSEAEVVIQRAAGLVEPIKMDDRNYFRVLMGIHRTKDSGSKAVKMDFFKEGQLVETRSFNLNIVDRSYRVQRFSIPAGKMSLFNEAEMDETWRMIDGAKMETSPNQLWEGAFIKPTEGVETLGFGDILYINGVYSGSHFGNDYANVQGTPINASNNGVVVLADYTPSYGNTVVIDHGQNVFTMYIHMVELKSHVGQEVKKGDLIALMGTTGISSGSHLHFTFFVGDVVVDSYQWYDGVF